MTEDDQESADYVAGYEEGYDLCKSVRKTLNEQLTTTRAELAAMRERADALALQADEWEGKYAAVSEMNAALKATLAERNNELHVAIARAQEWRSEAAEKDLLIHQLGENAAKAAGEYAEEVGRLREELRKANAPQWFYADGWEERCLHSPDEAIDLLDFAPGQYVTEVATARPCHSIWCAVRVTDDEDADERFTFTEHATEEAARAALTEPTDG